MKERLNKYANYSEIPFLEEIILYKISFGPEALLELRQNVMFAISFLSVGCKNIVLLFSFPR